MKSLTDVLVMRDGACPTLDSVANEVAVALQYNGISYAVMLCTPTDLDFFGIGFSLSEGLVETPDQIFDVVIEESASGITVAMEMAAGPFMHLKARRRSMAGRTGCGLCGVDSLASVERDIPAVSRQAVFPITAVTNAAHALAEHQTLQKITGATHAACHVNALGQISHVKEDVGRHNALDKCLGSLASTSSIRDGAIFVTSRASLEMVQKTAALGFGVLAAISAPTAAAIRLADKLGVTLVGFVRGDHYVIYTHAQFLNGMDN